MKKLNVIMLVILVLFVSCSSGTAETSAIEDVNNTPEGEGVSLSISEANSLSSVVYEIVVQKSFQYLKDNAMDLEEEQVAALCQNDQYSGEVDRVIEEGYSFYTYLNFDVLTQTRFIGDANARISFTDHAFTDPESGKVITLDGDVDHDTSGEMVLYDNDFITVFCDGSEDPMEHATGRLSVSNLTEGTVTLSGDIGGVLAFEVSDVRTMESENPGAPTAYNVEGTAVLKSGGNFFDCTIARPEYDGEYTVVCVAR